MPTIKSKFHTDSEAEYVSEEKWKDLQAHPRTRNKFVVVSQEKPTAPTPPEAVVAALGPGKSKDKPAPQQ